MVLQPTWHAIIPVVILALHRQCISHRIEKRGQRCQQICIGQIVGIKGAIKNSVGKVSKTIWIIPLETMRIKNISDDDKDTIHWNNVAMEGTKCKRI